MPGQGKGLSVSSALNFACKPPHLSQLDLLTPSFLIGAVAFWTEIQSVHGNSAAMEMGNTRHSLLLASKPSYGLIHLEGAGPGGQLIGFIKISLLGNTVGCRRVKTGGERVHRANQRTVVTSDLLLYPGKAPWYPVAPATSTCIRITRGSCKMQILIL